MPSEILAKRHDIYTKKTIEKYLKEKIINKEVKGEILKALSHMNWYYEKLFNKGINTDA